MGYTANNLSILTSNIGGRAARVWTYWTADSIATVVGAGYITDADKHRMQVGDIVWVFSGTLNTTGPDQVPSTKAGGTVSEFASAPSVAICEVSSISSGAATLTAAALVSESFASPTLTGTVKVGGTTSDSVGFYGTTPVTQTTSANQAAVATTAATNTSPFGYTTSTQANAIVTLVNELRLDLVNAGLIKGS